MTPYPALLSLLLLATSVARGQGTGELRGRVLDSSGSPIRGASITLASIGYSVRSDSSGEFVLSGTPGATLNLQFRAPGYSDETAAVLFPKRGATSRDFILTSASSPVAESNPSDRVVRAQVVDPDGAPLSYANVQVNGGQRLVTDDSGRIHIPIAAASKLSLLVRRIGFEVTEVRLASIPDTAIRVQLSAVAAILPEQRILGRAAFVSLDLGGFYRRMADVERGINRGYFITPEELEMRKPFIVTSAVEQLPNIRIRPSPFPLDFAPQLRNIPNPAPVKNPLNRYLRIEDGTGCPLTVFLDRIKISPVIIQGKLFDESINTLLIPTTLSGIEVYPRHLGTPPEFQLVDGTCGAVVFWTR